MKANRRFFAGLCLLVGTGVCVVALYYARPSLEAHAQAIVRTCASAEHRATCYEKEVPKLLERGVVLTDAFTIAARIQELDESGEYCHGIGHRLGSVEVAKNPGAWKEIARSAPMGSCLSGGLHGAFQERFRKGTLSEEDIPAFLAEVRGFCDVSESLPSNPIDLTMCAHGVGHLLLFVADGDIRQAANICENMRFSDGGGVTAESQTLSCYDGAFMQLFEPREAEDFALVAGKAPARAHVPGFCALFDEDRRGVCIARSAPLFFDGNLSSVPSCGAVTSAKRQDSCREAQARLFGRDTFFDPKAADAYCAAYPEGARGACYADIGSYALLSGHGMQQPLLLCEHAGGSACYRKLASFIETSFAQGSTQRKDFCAQLPPLYRASCGS